MKIPVYLAIRLYRRFISARLNRTCIYTPSCSIYLGLAVEKHGIWRGIRKAWQRLHRCRAEYLPGGEDWP